MSESDAACTLSLPDDQPAPPGGNSAFTLDRIRQYITREALKEGSRLPTERQFSAMFGVGRRAVRRALEALEAEGVVWRKQGAGTFLTTPEGPADPHAAIIERTDFAEIMEVRLRIEPPLAHLAAQRARPADIERMRLLSERIRTSRDADARELWDGMLHRLIAMAAGNSLFLTLFDTVNRIRQDGCWQDIRERARANTDAQMQSCRHHDEIIDCIARKDAAAAGAAMRRHLLMLQDLLLRQTSHAMGQSPPPAPMAPSINRDPDPHGDNQR